MELSAFYSGIEILPKFSRLRDLSGEINRSSDFDSLGAVF